MQPNELAQLAKGLDRLIQDTVADAPKNQRKLLVQQLNLAKDIILHPNNHPAEDPTWAFELMDELNQPRDEPEEAPQTFRP